MTSKIGLKVASVVTALYSGVATAAYQLNFTRGATRLTEDIYDLHNLMMWIITVIFCAVFGVMFYSVYAHRKSVGHKAAQFHENTAVELAWTIVPFFILIAMAIPATKTLLEVRDASNPDVTVKVTGYQWKWGYDYIKGEGEGVAFLANLSTPHEQIYGSETKGEHYLLETDRHLVLPVGKKIRILATAADVIHAWYVPDLGVKQDAIPGFVRDTWFRAEREGIYRGQCAELCGKDHGFMPIVVEVVSVEKYTAWVAETKKAMAAATDDPDKKWVLTDLKARGEKVYGSNCVTCHQANGQGIKGAFPALDGSKVVKGPKSGQIDVVLNGRSNTAMAAFGKQLSDTDIAAAITFTRNSWSNSTGEVVQPSEVKAARK